MEVERRNQTDPGWQPEPSNLKTHSEMLHLEPLTNQIGQIDIALFRQYQSCVGLLKTVCIGAQLNPSAQFSPHSCDERPFGKCYSQLLRGISAEQLANAGVLLLNTKNIISASGFSLSALSPSCGVSNLSERALDLRAGGKIALNWKQAMVNAFALALQISLARDQTNASQHVLTCDVLLSNLPSDRPNS